MRVPSFGFDGNYQAWQFFAGPFHDGLGGNVLTHAVLDVILFVSYFTGRGEVGGVVRGRSPLPFGLVPMESTLAKRYIS